MHTDMPGACAHTHTCTCMFTPGIPGPPRRAHLVNLANTWAHTWLSHIPRVLVPLACVRRGPIDPIPHHLPAPLASQTSSGSPLGFHHFLLGTQRAEPWRVKRVNQSRRGVPGLAMKLASPFSGALGHGLQCWGCPSFACGFWFDGETFLGAISQSKYDPTSAAYWLGVLGLDI